MLLLLWKPRTEPRLVVVFSHTGREDGPELPKLEPVLASAEFNTEYLRRYLQRRLVVETSATSFDQLLNAVAHGNHIRVQDWSQQISLPNLPPADARLVLHALAQALADYYRDEARKTNGSELDEFAMRVEKQQATVRELEGAPQSNSSASDREKLQAEIRLNRAILAELENRVWAMKSGAGYFLYSIWPTQFSVVDIRP